MYPYNIANNLDECECQQQCEKDPICNGYTIDDNTGTCSLSRCDNPDPIFTSSTNAISYSKKIPTSHLSCVPVTTGSTDTTLNSTTPTKKQTTLEQATLVASQIPMDESTYETNLTTMASSFYSESINDTTYNKVNNALCVCVCKLVNQTLEESIKKRRNELILNRTKLSSYMRKRTSAQDNRKTSRIVGIVAAIILVMYGVLFFCADIWTLLAMCHSKMMYRNNTIQPGI